MNSTHRDAFAQHIAARLREDQTRLGGIWNNPEGTQTRHCAVDHLLPPDSAREIAAAFPTDGAGFSTRSSFRERKRTSNALDKLPAALGEVAYALQSPEVLDAVADITGIERLEPDPRLYAGGLSMMFRGDFLNPHIDNSHDGFRARYRRVNLLYYLSPDWREEDGGNLELWDDRVRRPVTIPSLFNRLVLMETNSTSHHSVSPVRVDKPRCCVSSYYFSPQSPTGVDYYHVTSFTGRPGQPFRRALGVLDNAARNFARKLGARRSTDAGFAGAI